MNEIETEVIKRGAEMQLINTSGGTMTSSQWEEPPAGATEKLSTLINSTFVKRGPIKYWLQKNCAEIISSPTKGLVDDSNTDDQLWGF